MVLLLAMAFALAVGFLAWGPIAITAADHRFADERAGFGVPQVVNTLAGIPLLVAGVLGLRAAKRGHWPTALRTPWSVFFVMCTALSAMGIAYHVAPNDVGLALNHLFAAAALASLTMGFLAERVDARLGSRRVLAVAMGAVAAGGLWWWIGQGANGSGDLRPLLFLETLPVLLIPAGALSLAGHHTGAGDWLGMLGLYGLCRMAGIADSTIYALTGAISGHTVMHLSWAAVAAWLAYRAAVAPGSARVTAPALSDPIQRSTSLNTSS
ncbi:hypothetical protein [Piscinibacter sp. XHJ-5]|uniref:hypothetical protein n=1 Tax=Piscinibacter sp. XHJ-5 TaxID=3037797 RepID=UPI002452C670|nr:hypothetical protein [Piscinibacter sp. XHJ-5]